MSNIDTIDGHTAGLLHICISAETCLLEEACHHTSMPAFTRCLPIQACQTHSHKATHLIGLSASSGVNSAHVQHYGKASASVYVPLRRKLILQCLQPPSGAVLARVHSPPHPCPLPRPCTKCTVPSVLAKKHASVADWVCGKGAAAVLAFTLQHDIGRTASKATETFGILITVHSRKGTSFASGLCCILHTLRRGQTAKC